MGLKFDLEKEVILITAQEFDGWSTLSINGTQCWEVPALIHHLELDATLARPVDDTGVYDLANVTLEAGGEGEGGRVRGSRITKGDVRPIVDDLIWKKNTVVGT